MPSIDEEINGAELPKLDTLEDFQEDTVSQYRPSLMDVLKTPTGEGELHDYENHVLNFNQSKGMSRLIRGFTGLLGHNLNFAVVDIVIGAMDFLKPKTKGIEEHVYRGARDI